MESATKSAVRANRTATYADMFAALGAEPRLRIVRALLAAHPDGMVVGEFQAELEIAPSTLYHHLEKLKDWDLITVERESTFLRYRANTTALEELLGCLYDECCKKNRAIKPTGKSESTSRVPGRMSSIHMSDSTTSSRSEM